MKITLWSNVCKIPLANNKHEKIQWGQEQHCVCVSNISIHKTTHQRSADHAQTETHFEIALQTDVQLKLLIRTKKTLVNQTKLTMTIAFLCLSSKIIIENEESARFFELRPINARRAIQVTVKNALSGIIFVKLIYFDYNISK